MVHLPEYIEKKIFYYLSHPIANLLKQQEIVILYPRENIFEGTCFIFSKGVICNKEKGVYKIDSFKLNNILYKNPLYRYTRILYKKRILKRHLQSYIFKELKHKHDIKKYYEIFTNTQITANFVTRYCVDYLT